MLLELPYFDVILARLECGDPLFGQVFQRHVHFGVWPDADRLTDRDGQAAEAMERLTKMLLDMADIVPGQDILDVGCGLGGTLASLDERFFPVQLTGLNIDERQLQLASRRVQARNSLQWVLGDACKLPFVNASFDRVLAVECIFHFSSRQAFLAEVRRVLRPGGVLVISDFVLSEGTPLGQYDNATQMLWGEHSAIDLQTYQQLAQDVGMRLSGGQELSSQVLPSYDLYGDLLETYLPGADEVTRLSKFFMQVGAFGYCNLRFDLISV